MKLKVCSCAVSSERGTGVTSLSLCVLPPSTSTFGTLSYGNNNTPFYEHLRHAELRQQQHPIYEHLRHAELRQQHYPIYVRGTRNYDNNTTPIYEHLRHAELHVPRPVPPFAGNVMASQLLQARRKLHVARRAAAVYSGRTSFIV